MNTKKLYSVEIDINLGDDTFTTYIDVKANNSHEAYVKAVKKVNSSLDIRIEKNPKEALLPDDIFDGLQFPTLSIRKGV